MPIVVDYSNVSIAAIMASHRESKQEINLDLCQHTILNSLRKTNVKFRADFGQMIIVADDSNERCWRYAKFPHYKYKRKIKHQTDEFDWDMINGAKDETMTAIIENFPWPVVSIAGCEGDDVIGWYALNASEPTVIVGSDKDFFQCHSQLVCQWKPITKELLRFSDPSTKLRELLIKGDTDDGVPNFRSPDDVFTIPGARQKPISEKALADWLVQNEDEFLFTEEIKEKKVKGVIKPAEFIDRRANFERNRKLIDFRCIPDEFKPEIMDRMTKYQVRKNRSKTITWLAKHRMKYLMERIDHFF